MRSAEKQLGKWNAPSEIKAVKNSVRSGKINIRKFQREEQITKEEEKIKCAQEAQSQIKAVFVNGIRKRGGIIWDIFFLMRSLCLWTNVIDEVDLYQGTHYNVSGNWKMENSKIFQRQERKQMVYTSSEIQTILRCLNMSPGEGNGIPFQYCCLEKSHGRRSLAGCSPCGC